MTLDRAVSAETNLTRYNGMWMQHEFTDLKTVSAAPLPPGIAVRGDAEGELTRRAHAEQPHPYRTPFARDAARVLHTRAFRRLAGKTQVFTRLPPTRLPVDAPSDHSRTRLTHTLEVTQIARTLARALGLNAELSEALALSHDIGHPPFGHAGEKALDRALRAHGLSFDHNLHALRIVTWFEERYPAFRGLNLTLGVREGIVKHSRDYAAAEHPELAEYFLDRFPPLEAQLIDLADEIAYLTADLDDGLDTGILALDEAREAVPLFRRFHDAALAQYPEAAPRLAVYDALRRLLNAMVTDLACETGARVAAIGAATLDDVRRAPARLAALSAEMEAARAGAKEFLYAKLYNSPGMEEEHAHASRVVQELFDGLMADPGMLPADHRAQIPTEGLARTVADYIAGMTDSYIEQNWQRYGR
ncbi:MAG: dGTP triphosphohydrolase [Terracidiphilus sp.]